MVAAKHRWAWCCWSSLWRMAYGSRPGPMAYPYGLNLWMCSMAFEWPIACGLYHTALLWYKANSSPIRFCLLYPAAHGVQPSTVMCDI